jgi:DMSO reductase anchor subunit
VNETDGPWMTVLPLAALLLCGALWLCTAMIYACLRFVQEWAHPLTVANYTLIGLSSGLVLSGALAALANEPAYSIGVAPWALAATLAAWWSRAASLSRNARLKPKSTLQSATGLKAARVVQASMGMTAGSYNTREFFHRASLATFRRIKITFLILGFGVPVLLLAWALAAEASLPFLLAVPVQCAGLVAERWFFFAEARHPQNLYYQTVS